MYDNFCELLQLFDFLCRKGILFTLGNPLVDISANVDENFLKK